ncbi:MAG: hypothetical protein WCO22_17200, partial [Betaproteobacteria bacterium]
MPFDLADIPHLRDRQIVADELAEPDCIPIQHMALSEKSINTDLNQWFINIFNEILAWVWTPDMRWPKPIRRVFVRSNSRDVVRCNQCN